MATRKRRAPSPALPRRLQPRKRPTQARSRALVDAIVQAGSELLVDRGFEALTLQDVAARAGVSPGSLYQYFPDKAALVTELTERLSERELAFHAARFSTAAADASLEETLSLVLSTTVAFQREVGPVMRAALAALPHLGRYEQLADRARQASRLLEALLEPHAARLPVDVALATHVIANVVHSLTHDGILARPQQLDDDTLVRELKRVVFGYLGLPAAPR
jgi:AcrR family transcriptional regulator